MSDENTPVTPTATVTKKPKPDLTKVTPYSVTRNAVTKSLTAFAGTRGAWDGVVYQAPQISEATINEDIAWFGVQNIIRTVNIVARRMAQDYWDDAIPETGDQAGIFQEATFLRLVSEWSAASMKISELIELYNEAVEKYQAATPTFIAEMTAAAGDATKTAEAAAKFQALSDAVTSIKAELEARKARRSKEAATETVVPN